MNGDESAIEPELLLPPPRIVRRKFRVRFVRWLFMTMAIIGPAILIGCGVKSQQNWTALRDHGAKTVGRIIQKSARTTGKNASPPRAKFEYRVDDQSHFIWDDLTDDEYRTLLLGAEKAISYLPENPGVAETTEDLVKGSDTSSLAVALWFTAGILSLISLPLWLWIESQQRRWQNLLTSGRAVRTTSVAIEKTWLSAKGYSKVRYTFPIDGEQRTGSASVEADVAKALAFPGAEATVLYDPEDTRRFELYPPMAKCYRIESPQLQF